MPRTGFEQTIPVIEWSKAISASDSAAAGIGCDLYLGKIKFLQVTINFSCRPPYIEKDTP